MRRVRLTWTIGGIGLVLCGVIGMLLNLRLEIGPILYNILDVMYPAVVMLFTIGLSKQSSVVARRPLGVIAFTLFALWPFAVRMVYPHLPEMNRQTEDGLAAFSFASVLVSYAAALIGSLQIARAGVVPTPWRWAPLGAVLVSFVALMVIRPLLWSAGAPGAQIASALELLARTAGLGILALVLAYRLRDGSVENAS